MRRLGATEKGIIVLAGAMALAGFSQIVSPTEGYMDSNSVPSRSGVRVSVGEYVTKGKARLYGFGCVVLGSGLIFAVFYPFNRRN
jgi:hypothetical protein